jgi:hypothetical protein
MWNGSTWTILQDWSSSPILWWVPTAAGSYQFQVWTRNAGSTAMFDAWAGTGASIGDAVPLEVTRFTMSPMSPLVVNGPATLTVIVKGGIGPQLYKFWVYNGCCWSLEQWSDANSFTWVPPAAGTYTFQVWIRNAESTTDFDTWASFGPVTVVP